MAVIIGNTGNFKVKFKSPTQNVTLKNTTVPSRRLDSLSDVDVTVSQANGSILVYNSATDTYVQRDVLTFDNEGNAFKLDGGADGF